MKLLFARDWQDAAIMRAAPAFTPKESTEYSNVRVRSQEVWRIAQTIYNLFVPVDEADGDLDAHVRR